LPQYIGGLLSGRTTYQDYSFPPINKPSGTTVLLKIRGTYDWHGTFTATLRVVLP
jgi:hypothetical protein